ncbi:MAG TPA: hypothetical protein EYN91_18900 [Candidatus Melainabacteria bacterium]|nr:hypothetical protein [Candidatus Melainabacteria bacterium]HIN63638.1 hypothetical protein [Candidatus Obscuribacterales bacterium]
MLSGELSVEANDLNRFIKWSIVIFVVLLIVFFTQPRWFENSRDKLTDTEDGINHVFRQNREPTAKEREVGMTALKRWKSANDAERNCLADEIVLGRVLIGLTQREIIGFMGKPDGFGSSNDIGPQIRLTGYNCANGESQCDLMIELNDDGKTSDVYLNVNY